jgi:hypothetical protein
MAEVCRHPFTCISYNQKGEPVRCVQCGADLTRSGEVDKREERWDS